MHEDAFFSSSDRGRMDGGDRFCVQADDVLPRGRLQSLLNVRRVSQYIKGIGGTGAVPGKDWKKQPMEENPELSSK